MSPELSVVVVGASGRMGTFARGLLGETPGFHVAACLDRGDDLAAGLAAADAVLALDLTVAGRGHAHGVAMLEAGLRPVIGTSGVQPEEVEDLDRRARERGLGGLVVPNFSLGMHLLQNAAVEAARHLGSAEIIEMHHTRKQDAPSGTALDTARRLAGPLGGADVPIHSVRLPGLYAHQEVLLSGPGETLTLRHDMQGPAAFGPGILAALRWAATAEGVASGIGRALE